MDPTKKFGLVMPKKSEMRVKAKSIFDSDSEDEAPKSKRPKIPQKKIDFNSKIKEVSLEDPSIYEYDSIYDDMKAKQAESIAPKEKQNSRYIETLLKAADKRKKQYERRVEKKIQVEREKEGDKFKDKEEFVTSTYKKKMQEREEEEERERREEMVNDMMDVKKQKDLSGFYRHFLKQTIGEEKVPKFGEKFIKQEIPSDEESRGNKNEKSVIKTEGKSNEKEKLVIKTELESITKKNKGSEICKENTEAGKEKIDFRNLDRDSDGIEIDSDSSSQSSDNSKKLSDKKKNRKNSSLRSSRSSTPEKNKSSKDKQKTSPNAAKKTGLDSSGNSSDSGKEHTNDKHKKKSFSRSKKTTGTTFETISNQRDSKEKDASNKHKIDNNKSSKNHKYEKLTKVYRKPENFNSESESETEKNVPEKANSPKIADKVTVVKQSRYESKVKAMHLRRDSSDNSEEAEITLNHNDKPVEKEDNSVNEKKERQNIYAKRTVGDIFAQAQARYFQRMAERKN